MPFTISVKAGPPAAATFGLIVVIAGNGFAAVIVKVTAFEFPPTGGGFDTVMTALPGAVMSLAGIVAVSNVALVDVVGRSNPFHRTTEVDIKPVPVIVSVSVPLPAVAEPGLILLMVGSGLLIEKFTAFDVPPPGPGLKTEILEVPPAARSLAAMEAEIWVLLTKTVARFDPFQRTLDPLTKLLPLTTNVNGSPPVTAEVGATLVMLGVGLLIANAAAAESPPPGLATVTLAVPAAAMSLAGIAALN